MSFRADGDLGVSLPFPLLIFKNVQVGLSGGWLVNRIYLKDKDLRDFGWLVHYTGSASRWVDGYVAAGWEYDVVDTDNMGGTRARNLFVTENGNQAAGQHPPHADEVPGQARHGLLGAAGRHPHHRPLGFDQIGYVFEFGGGSW